MNAQDRTLSFVLCLVLGGVAVLPASAQKTVALRLTDKQIESQRKALEAIKTTEHEAAAMVPGRTWTWQLRAEQSREHLVVFGRALDALRAIETSFEASLTPDQESKFAPQFQTIRETLQHVSEDVRSLDEELQKGYPERWHVTHDVLDMQSEIHRLRKVHEQISKANGSR